MGTFAAYTFTAGILLLAGYIIYKWLLATENQPRFNRWLLLMLYIAAFCVLPAVDAVNSLLPRTTAIAEAAIPQFMTMAYADRVAPAWPTIILWIYLAGMAATFAWTAATILRLLTILVRNNRVRREGYTLVTLSGNRLAPFSWGHYIFVDNTDDENETRMILRHEQAHIAAGHFFDLLLAQTVCIILWYNPASWLMLSELKAVHEYEADERVLSSGTDARQYQLLLVKKAVGARFPSLANSLNHSKLKKRITMMYNQKTSKVRRLRALAIVPAVIAALAIVKSPALSSAMNTASATPLLLPSVSDSKGTTFSVDTQTAPSDKVQAPIPDKAPQVMPQFPGGEDALLKYLSTNLRYPESAQNAGIEGLVVVNFIVGADGEVKEPSIAKSAGNVLDREAMRIVISMPKWTPGSENGKPVDVRYTLPVNFRIPDKKPAEAPAEETVIETTSSTRTSSTSQNRAIEVTADTTIVVGFYVDGKKVEQNVPIPVVFVDNVLWSKPLGDIKTDDIESITVRKDLKEYPDGAIFVTLKK